jgi:hypothetical protein
MALVREREKTMQLTGTQNQTTSAQRKLPTSLLRAAALAVTAAWAALAPSAQGAGTVGAKLFSTGGDVIVTVMPATAGYTSELRLYSPGPELFVALNTDVGTVVNLGSFPVGEELLFGIYVRDTGDTFKMGEGARNPDGLEHAAVDTGTPGVTVVGFEDLFGGGDLDYDDNVFQFSGGIAALPCPANVTATAGSSACSTVPSRSFGLPAAVVNYTDPSLPGTTVVCIPPSGAEFPAGTNTVTCTATFGDARTVSCSFQVVVIPGRGAKECVYNQLVALRATVTNEKDGKMLDEATYDDLVESLDPALWVDETHLDRKRGGDVFQNEREVSKILCALMKKNNSGIDPAVFQFLIDELLAVDRALVVVAINDAIVAGRPAKTIEKAVKELLKGDASRTGEKCYKAFDYYRSAWKLVAR